MSLLAWNCQGSGGSLGNPKMLHLARLITSTNVQVIFVSETRNSRLTRSDLIASTLMMRTLFQPRVSQEVYGFSPGMVSS